MYRFCLTQVNSDLEVHTFGISINGEGATGDLTAYRVGRVCIVQGTLIPRMAGTPLTLFGVDIPPVLNMVFHISSYDHVGSYGVLHTTGIANCNIPAELIGVTCIVSFCYATQ